MLLKNILIIMFIGGVVVSVTFFSDAIKQYVTQNVQTQAKKVLGISIDSYQKSDTARLIQDNVHSSLQSVQQQIVHVNIGDVISLFSRGQKIVNDISGLKEQANLQLEKLAK